MNQLAAAESTEASDSYIVFLPVFVFEDKPDSIIVNEPCTCTRSMKQAATRKHARGARCMLKEPSAPRVRPPLRLLLCITGADLNLLLPYLSPYAKRLDLHLLWHLRSGPSAQARQRWWRPRAIRFDRADGFSLCLCPDRSRGLRQVQ